MRMFSGIPESTRKRMVRRQLEDLMKLNDDGRLESFTYIVGVRDQGMVSVDYATYCVQGEQPRIAQVLLAIAGRLAGGIEAVLALVPLFAGKDPREAGQPSPTRH